MAVTVFCNLMLVLNLWRIVPRSGALHAFVYFELFLMVYLLLRAVVAEYRPDWRDPDRQWIVFYAIAVLTLGVDALWSLLLDGPALLHQSHRI